MRSRTFRSAKALVALSVGSLGVIYAASTTIAGASQDGLVARQILLGSSLNHSFTPSGSTTAQSAPLSNPDDITQLGDDIFVGFQNGVGPQGQPSTSGNGASTIVEFTQKGNVLGQWDVAGKVDGLSADPQLSGVIATVNEDANSSLYVIRPHSSNTITHYTYNSDNTALAHNGGTDAISIYHGQILISASAPGTSGPAAPDAAYPAVYVVDLPSNSTVATMTPLFFDEDSATVADGTNQGGTVALALTDPDSSEIVPNFASRFGGDFMLTSQGDQEQIFVSDATSKHQALSVLTLSQSVDDTAWASGRHEGTLFSTDSTNNAVDAITGDFPRGDEIAVATPCGSNSAPTTCPGSGFSANYLASVNMQTGNVSALSVSGATYVPQGGLVFVAGQQGSH